MFSQGSPWTPTRAGLAVIDTSMRETLLTLWNTFSFFTTYAALNGFDPADPGVPPPAQRPDLDRWVLSRLAVVVHRVTESLDSYQPLEAATALTGLVEEVSNWYVRRSRRRFWRTDPGAPPADSLAAQATLHEVLVTVSLLLAPFCPFVADRMWRALTGAGEEQSVHLADWPPDELRPTAEGGLVDEELERRMAQARRLTSLGRAARSEAGVKVRQPLARALVFLPAGAPAVLEAVVEDELNVDEVVVTEELGEVLRFQLLPNFKLLGPRLGGAAQQVRAALARLDGPAASEAAAALESGGSITVELPEGPVELTGDEVELRVKGQPGFAVSREGGEVVALDLAIDDRLRRRGLVREVVRLIQDLRKSSGLAVSDRISLHLSGLADIAPWYDDVGREVLATDVGEGPGDGPGHPLELEGSPGARVWIDRV